MAHYRQVLEVTVDAPALVTRSVRHGSAGGTVEVVGDPSDTAPYGIILIKNQGRFAQAEQGHVMSLMTDGTYKTILEKWNVSNGAVPTSEIRS